MRKQNMSCDKTFSLFFFLYNTVYIYNLLNLTLTTSKLADIDIANENVTVDNFWRSAWPWSVINILKNHAKKIKISCQEATCPLSWSVFVLLDIAVLVQDKTCSRHYFLFLSANTFQNSPFHTLFKTLLKLSKLIKRGRPYIT